IGSESVAFAAVTDATSYHIIYRARNSAEFNSQTAYIIVDETRLAQIQFKPATAVPTRSCVHSGRFDLCPI
ncbi:MAG: hypothetical protein KDI55_27855, partial [Anaerolineae bacterium]|nr:hypothetical protein [Anaerolineae bacterium]